MLELTISDPTKWLKYKNLFDRNMTSKNVSYFRSIISLAGPISTDFNSSFENLGPERSDQEVRVKNWQTKIRD